ncbi:putative addiction module antidote protein [Aquamicrobium lusatiense]|uniref:addiction module antidote protein n=1 Tax=Aquamicrobium lusatiense TaxID=89772 RepID=UPI002458FC0B|nr:addiction module antidote protein [Aquamicrobium lusatiense]MDH4990694.1 putative addiction module antidote protein [Aquamicrobium lusatiense]
MGTVARARGMAEIAAAANLNPKSIYRALSSGGNPEFTTVFKVLSAMGYTLTIKPAPD